MINIREFNFSDLYEMSSGISSKPEQAGHGSPFVSFSTVFNNFFLPDTVNDLMDTSEREQELYSIKAGDILLTRTSETIDELGMSCVVLRDYPKATFSGFAKRLRPKQERITYPRYMGFYLRSKFFRKTMTNNAVLTLRASLNEEIFSYLKLYLPDYETQKRIGDFLYSLNQKIALNFRINAELEAMAKTIYDYWFVQFDFPISKQQAKVMGNPKLDGKPYKASGGKMVWSEELKREVPEGWGISSIETVALFENGKSVSKHQMSALGKYNVFGSNGPIAKTNEMLFEEPVIAIGRVGANYGEVNYSLDPCWISDNAITSRPLKAKYFWWLLLTLKSIKYKGIAGGSAQPLITQGQLRRLQFAVPPDPLFNNFHEMVHSCFLQIQNHVQQNTKLSEMCDWLLPMLMNGQVRIKNPSFSKTDKMTLSANTPANSYFYQTQLVATIVNASKKHKITHGEMTLAKYTYLVDKLYGVPTYFNYERLHLGPYPKEMKKIVNNKEFFKIQNNEVSVVPQGKEYKYQFQKQVEGAVAGLASIFNQYKGQERSHQIELIATVCKVVEDIKSLNLKEVRESMENWPIDLKTSKFKNKAEKFSEEQTSNCLVLLEEKGFDTKLLV